MDRDGRLLGRCVLVQPPPAVDPPVGERRPAAAGGLGHGKPGLVRPAGRALTIVLVGGEHRSIIAERLELQSVAGWIEHEAGELFARQPLEPGLRFDQELNIGTPQAGDKVMPGPGVEQETKVAGRDLLTVDGVSGNRLTVVRVEVGHDLVAPQVEINPHIGRPTLTATQYLAVEPPSPLEIVDGKGEMKPGHAIDGSGWC